MRAEVRLIVTAGSVRINETSTNATGHIPTSSPTRRKTAPLRPNPGLFVAANRSAGEPRIEAMAAARLVRPRRGHEDALV